jgi:hypothetical protein
VAAEGEHGQGYECLGGAEAERDAGEESDLGVGPHCEVRTTRKLSDPGARGAEKVF